MANFSQLRRRQSSREMIFRRQLSTLMEDLEGERAELAFAAMATAPGGGGRTRHFSASARATLRRQLSEATPPRTSAEQLDSDELGELMWEMRPRFATSAGELKRRRKHEWLQEKEWERKEVGAALM